MLIDMKLSREAIVIVAIILLSAALLADWYLTAPQPLPLLPDGKLTDAKSKAIDIMITRSNLIANWNIGTVAACIYILMNGNNFKPTRTTIALSLLSISTALLSVFFAQNIMDIITRTLFAEQDPVYSQNLFYASSAQYLFTGVSLFFFLGSIVGAKFMDNLK